MGKRMKLIDVVKNIDNYEDEMTIYAARPWSSRGLADKREKFPRNTPNPLNCLILG